MDHEEILLEEWKEIRVTLRYFGNKRFAQLTVFIVASGFMFDTMLNRQESCFRTGLAVTGIVFALLFLMMEISSVRYWKAFVGRSKQIENDLAPLKLMTESRPELKGLKKVVTGTFATYALYCIVVGLWILALALGWGLKAKGT